MSIRVTDLEKRYHESGAPVLRGVSLHVPAGKIAGVLGESGAGKTTLLRCLVGLEPFDAGTIELAGERISRGDAGALLGRVGLVFQSFELFPHLSVLDNVALAPIRARRVPRAQAEARAASLLDDLGLADKAKAYPDALSGGQRQRVAIARALAINPRVLLYDEPTSALDPSLKREVGCAIRRVAGQGVTQILVTHDLDVAREIADLVFLLEAGKVSRSGTPREVLDGRWEGRAKPAAKQRHRSRLPPVA